MRFRTKRRVGSWAEGCWSLQKHSRYPEFNRRNTIMSRFWGRKQQARMPSRSAALGAWEHDGKSSGAGGRMRTFRKPRKVRQPQLWWFRPKKIKGWPAPGATTGKVVVTTPSGNLTHNV